MCIGTFNFCFQNVILPKNCALSKILKTKRQNGGISTFMSAKLAKQPTSVLSAQMYVMWTMMSYMTNTVILSWAARVEKREVSLASLCPNEPYPQKLWTRGNHWF